MTYLQDVQMIQSGDAVDEKGHRMTEVGGCNCSCRINSGQEGCGAKQGS